ncbi:MAG: urease accessory protein UreF [Stappiaceae bacterium]
MEEHRGMTIITMPTDSTISLSNLYRLLAWLSPSFPVGAYTYSHGLEWVIEEGQIDSPESLYLWLKDILLHGAGRSDAILLAHTMYACEKGDEAEFDALKALGLALQPSKERLLESEAQGSAFMRTVSAAWQPADETPAARLFKIRTQESMTGQWPYPVAVGLTAAAAAIPADAVLAGYLHAFAANIISAAVRAVPLGQTDGQHILAQLEPICSTLASEAPSVPLDEIGSACFLADIASMKHETQYTRLFRS